VPERSVSTEVDNGTPPDGEWQRNGGIPASSSQIAIEVTSSPGQSTPNLPVEGTDEERGRLLASEFIDGDQTHITSDKVAMFLGGPRHVNNAALRYYMQYFDMRGLKLDQAFRELCAKLHLKAESQEIDRIIEAFSARFYDCNPNTVFGTPGVIHTVTGAMLMLNTDLHIADLQKHMSRADFVRNSMRAIQESMPAGTEPPSDPTNNDSGSLRGIDVSASQSTTSVRLRATASRNASGSLSTELSSNSAADLRSRASSTTVNSFTYTKAWEIEAETALKEIFANVRNERILLPISPMTMPDSDRSQASLGGFGKGVSGAVAGAMNNIKRNARGTGNNGNSPYGSMFTHSDGRLSPTPPYANSIGEQFQPLAPALGFAGNLSHTVIREQEDETHSINSKETMGTLEELNDDELALLGAPWAKEGLLQRKIQVEAQGKKPQKKDWKQYFVVIQRGDLHMFVFGASGGSSIGGGAVGGGNWMVSEEVLECVLTLRPTPRRAASTASCTPWPWRCPGRATLRRARTASPSRSRLARSASSRPAPRSSLPSGSLRATTGLPAVVASRLLVASRTSSTAGRVYSRSRRRSTWPTRTSTTG
jgi:PH/SEC7 domain-containing protein